MTETTQPVVEDTKTSAQPDVKVEPRTDDVDPLDKLLAEYDRGTATAAPISPPEPKPQPVIDPAIADRLRRVEDRMLQEDVETACKEVFGDLQIPKRAQIGWLDQMARENPKIGQMFLNKATDPGSWKRAAKTLAKEAEKDFAPQKKADEDATADRFAVAASVRGASTKTTAEPPAKLGQMSEAEFQKYTRENYGF